MTPLRVYDDMIKPCVINYVEKYEICICKIHNLLIVT